MARFKLSQKTVISKRPRTQRLGKLGKKKEKYLSEKIVLSPLFYGEKDELVRFIGLSIYPVLNKDGRKKL